MAVVTSRLPAQAGHCFRMNSWDWAMGLLCSVSKNALPSEWPNSQPVLTLLPLSHTGSTRAWPQDPAVRPCSSPAALPSVHGKLTWISCHHSGRRLRRWERVGSQRCLNQVSQRESLLNGNYSTLLSYNLPPLAVVHLCLLNIWPPSCYSIRKRIMSFKKNLCN